MTKYLPIIQDINRHVSNFNKFLKPEYSVQILDEMRFTDEKYLTNLNGKVWKEIRFPNNCGCGGVYFYFGYSVSNPEHFCVYVGKASLNRTTGQRLWSHFKHSFDEEGRIFKLGSQQNRFNIEEIIIIELETPGMTCFAPALEEYIITELAKEGKYEMLNIKGNG